MKYLKSTRGRRHAVQNVPARFERWLREAHRAPSQTASRTLLVVIESTPLGLRTPFGWISYEDSPSGGCTPLTLDLWAIRRETSSRAAFGEVCGSLELANCHYDETVEGYVLRGLAASRPIVLRANLVSPSVEPDPFFGEVAQSGTRVRLWTYSLSPSGFEVFPYCPAPVPEACRLFRPLAGLLSELSGAVTRRTSGTLSGDRRRFERRPVVVLASVGFAGAGARALAEREATISDLSSRGACLTGLPLQDGLGALEAGAVELRSAVGGRSFFARGSVVRLSVHRKEATLGVEFSGRPRVG